MKAKILMKIYICIVLYQFAAQLLALENIRPVFGTKPEGLSANVNSAKGYNFEGWNPAGLGFLDRKELIFEVGLFPFINSPKIDSQNYQTIYVGYSRPTMKWGTFSLGIADFLDIENNTDYFFPYIGYSREFMNLFSFGGIYALETKLANNELSPLYGIGQFGLMANIYDYIRLNASIENLGSHYDIESMRIGASIIFPALSRNGIFISADINSSLDNIKYFKSAESQWENLNIGGGIKIAFILIRAWVSKNLANKDSSCDTFLEVSLSKNISDDRLHSISFGSKVHRFGDDYFMAGEIVYASGESISARKSMDKAERLMSGENIGDAKRYYGKSQRLFLSENQVNTAKRKWLLADSMLKANREAYNNGLDYYNKKEYNKAIKEFEKIPSWSELYSYSQKELNLSKDEYAKQLYDSAKIKLNYNYPEEAKQYLAKIYALDPKYRAINQYQDLEKQIGLLKSKEIQAKLKLLYQEAMEKYIKQQFDEANEAFKKIISIEPSYSNARSKLGVSEKLASAMVYYRQAKYDKSIGVCSQVLLEYPDDLVAQALYNKVLGESEYDKNNLEYAIKFWNTALDIERNLGIYRDRSLENRLSLAKKRLAIADAKQAIEQREYDKAISILSQYKDYEPALDIMKILQFYRQAILEIENKQYLKAEKELLKCLSIDPNFDYAINDLEKTYKDLLSEVRIVFFRIPMDRERKILGEIEPKLKAIVDAQYADPKDIASAYLYLACIHIILPPKDEERARQLFMNALESDPMCILTKDIDFPDTQEIFKKARTRFLSESKKTDGF